MLIQFLSCLFLASYVIVIICFDNNNNNNNNRFYLKKGLTSHAILKKKISFKPKGKSGRKMARIDVRNRTNQKEKQRSLYI